MYNFFKKNFLIFFITTFINLMFYVPVKSKENILTTYPVTAKELLAE